MFIQKIKLKFKIVFIGAPTKVKLFPNTIEKKKKCSDPIIFLSVKLFLILFWLLIFFGNLQKLIRKNWTFRFLNVELGEFAKK